jgi:hypothetical protein
MIAVINKQHQHDIISYQTSVYEVCIQTNRFLSRGRPQNTKPPPGTEI